MDPLDVIHSVYMPGVDEVGRLFGWGEMFLPELVQAGEAMKLAIAVPGPEMARRGRTAKNFRKGCVGYC